MQRNRQKSATKILLEQRGLSRIGFFLNEWENRSPYYALMKLDERKICTLETTWASARSKVVRSALTIILGGGWRSVIKEAGKQSFKYGCRKALGSISTVICVYFGTASILLITKAPKVIKCAKICHSACSEGLDVAELCASAPIHALEVVIFGRPVLLKEGEGFDLFEDGESDPISDLLV